ncbi:MULTISPECIES: M28 family metallopeptidase [unclassified Methanoculleus]|uniref:M28 family metallopeptidase n=1 Tax=unclassified Methanoculleus TaxID=2619537 RepID=UPI0025E962F3|nr:MULTISPECIES: M28 family metallopeptidase [unclassified Methanoculleus]MCK9316784.1 M28 family metallopeptidase [Methanoculleus sp.]MDD2252755.1 M28 family metallopeptidase [Methanoculleus sp.]MDD2786478.1 M28 family metallopeptidase [Methanoculleus sp.]MDD3215262.1 M28 family metallopeptidase [Methanoculleus sp.]MDD4312998.1 M28 family metallopeptidase [Methanoculleus sp.]
MKHDSACRRDTQQHTRRPRKTLISVLLLVGTALLVAAAAGATGEQNPAIAAMLTEVNESDLQETTYDLQEISTRVFGTPGNREAGEYLAARLDGIPGIEVEFQGGDLRNVIATLPGKNTTSDEVVVVGAHYDSRSSDPARAPGATDNGCGVAIVLELAEVMSRHSFDRTVQFAFWNAEENGRYGSTDYAGNTADASVPVVLYLNYDSACYDPLNRSVLDIMCDENSSDIAALMTDYNTLYATNFTLTVNNNTCASDHLPFQDRGYPAVMTHCEGHGSAHTPDDTVDHVSFQYAVRNARLGLSVLAEMAGIGDDAESPTLPRTPVADDPPPISWNRSGRVDRADR